MYPKPCTLALNAIAFGVHGDSKKDDSMNEKIWHNAQIYHGKAMMRDTRVLVSSLPGALTGRDWVKEFIKNFPNITQENVCTALKIVT